MQQLDQNIFPSEITLDNLDAALEKLSKFPYTEYTSSFPMNCFLFISYVLQWIHGRDPFDLSPLPRLPVDAPKNDPDSCDVAFKKLFGNSGLWPGSMLWQGFKNLKAGDILICRINKVPGHMMIVGGDGRIWHSNPSGTKVHDTEVIHREKPNWHYRPFACGKIK